MIGDSLIVNGYEGPVLQLPARPEPRRVKLDLSATGQGGASSRSDVGGQTEFRDVFGTFWNGWVHPSLDYFYFVGAEGYRRKSPPERSYLTVSGPKTHATFHARIDLDPRITYH